MNDTDYEPMDIDSSSNSYTAMEISYNETVLGDNEHPEKVVENKNLTPTGNIKKEVKKIHLNIRPLRKNNVFYFSNRYTLFFFFFGSVIISILSYKAVNFKCSYGFNVKLIKKSLSSKVIGQQDAIETLIRAMEVNASSKILFLYGGTGVGKSLSISIVLDEMLNCSNVYHYTMPTFAHKFSTELNLGLIFCKETILVVDDLNAEDKHIKPIIRDIIDKTESLGKNITIILVYSCDNMYSKFVKACNKSFLTGLQQVFGNVKALKIFIRYKPLNEEHLKKCIENELVNSQISNVDVNMVMKNFNVAHDGCKGVYTKVKSLKIV
ncbi:unnamed protein product [Parnassius mnemosyne]|uniref:ATPase AAA-type core domain-containing protein n=1 Tax=Parnassius mnemosyne TaxID=213953 RepID=A0AAV1M9G7_9NEOP